MMKEITFNQFVQDFNEHYDTNYKVIKVDSNTYLSAIEEIYDCDYMEIDWDKELIEVY